MPRERRDPPSRSRVDRPAPPPPRPTTTLPTPLVVWARVGLGALLAGAMTQWPYAVCGLPLAFYLLGTAMVLVMGLWGARDAWRTRMATAHVLAIALLFAGTALAAHQILTRVGYTAVEATWRCTG